jgi:hypothetical protein
VNQGHGRDGFVDDVVPFEMKANSNTRHREPNSFPMHISDSQLQMLLSGGLLAHVNDRGIFLYDKDAITRLYVSYQVNLDYNSHLSPSALKRLVRREKMKRGER